MMPTSTDPSHASRAALLADTALRAGLARFVRGRVPVDEVDDIVQAALTEALASQHAPEGHEDLRRWVYGIARHKCADFYRHQRREGPAPDPMDERVPAEGEPLSAREWLRWAEHELPEGEHAEHTLRWMLREASGDKLESIAAEEQVPAPRVRQRVARMRKHFRIRWAAQVAAIVAAVTLLVASAWQLRRWLAPTPVADEIRPERVTPVDPAIELRRKAAEACARQRWESCLALLDDAERIDPEGDRVPQVQSLRQAAAAGLERTSPAPTQLGPEPVDPMEQQAPTPNEQLPTKGSKGTTKGSKGDPKSSQEYLRGTKATQQILPEKSDNVRSQPQAPLPKDQSPMTNETNGFEGTQQVVPQQSNEPQQVVPQQSNKAPSQRRQEAPPSQKPSPPTGD